MNWKSITVDEGNRIRKTLEKARAAGVPKEQRSCYIYGFRQFLSGVMTAYQTTFTDHEKKVVPQEFDLIIGLLEQDEQQHES